MDPSSLKRRLLFRGCRLVGRSDAYVLLENGTKRAVIPMHRGSLPPSLVRKILADLEMTLR